MLPLHPADSEVIPDTPLGPMIVHHPLRPPLESLRRSSGELAAGGCIGYAIRLDGAPIARLFAAATFRMTSWRVRRIMQRAGADLITRYAVDPRLETPSVVYELDSEASAYADRCLRARGRLLPFRKLAARCIGCDPALGAVVLVGRKR